MRHKWGDPPPKPCAHSGSTVLSRGEQSAVLGSGQNFEAAGGLLQLYLQWPQPPPHAVSPAGHTPSSRAQARRPQSESESEFSSSALWAVVSSAESPCLRNVATSLKIR